jgi:hypothetical protein
MDGVTLAIGSRLGDVDVLQVVVVVSWNVVVSTEVVYDVDMVVNRKLVVDTEVVVLTLVPAKRYPAPAPTKTAITSVAATGAPLIEVEWLRVEGPIKFVTRVCVQKASAVSNQRHVFQALEALVAGGEGGEK